MHFRLPLATAALVVAGSLLPAAPSLAAEPVEDALKAWVAAIDASPQFAASYGTLTVVGGTAVMSDLRITAEGGPPIPIEVTADTLTVAGFRPGQPGGFSADDVAVGVIRATLGQSTTTFTTFRLRGLTVPDFASVSFDPNQPFTSIMRFYKLFLTASLAEGSIADVTTVQTMGSEQSSVTYRNLALAGFSGGKIASMTAGPLSMSAPSRDGLIRFVIDKLESYDTDLGVFVHVYDPDAYAGGRGDMQWRTAMRLAAYRNMSIEAPGARITLHDLELSDLRMRQPPAPVMPYLDSIMTNPVMSQRQQEELAERYALDLVASMGIGRFSLRGLDVTSNDFNRFHIGEFVLADASLDGLGEIAINDFDLAANGDGPMQGQRAAIGDIVFPPLEAIRSAMTAEREGRQVDAMALIPKLGFLEINGLHLIRLDEGPADIGRLLLTGKGHVGPIPTDVEMQMRGFEVPVALAGTRQGSSLSDLGYTTIRFDFGYRVVWNEADSTVRLENFSLDLADIGSLQGDLTIGGLTRAMLEHPETLAETSQNLQFVDARFTVKDQSLLSRIIGVQAARAGQTPEAFRKQITDALPFFLMALQNAGFQAKVAPALQSFLTTPDSLTIVAKPREPVSFSSLVSTMESAPQRLPDLLSIEVSVP